MSEKTYIAIDLKSFYASVECTERGLDPMTTIPLFVSKKSILILYLSSTFHNITFQILNLLLKYFHALCPPT